MEARLRPVNAVLGLLTPYDVNPAVLANASFTLAGLEIPAVGAEGKVVINVSSFNPTTGLLVCFRGSRRFLFRACT